MSRRTKAPNERYERDVAGMPCYAANAPFMVRIIPENMIEAIARDDENCAIAKGCRDQLKVPYVSVGRHRTDLALPHPKGVEKPGFDGLWAVIRFKNPPEARRVIIAADKEELDLHHGVVLELQPPDKSDRPKRRRERANNTTRKPLTGNRRQPDQTLTLAGVRSLTGQRR